MKILVHFCADGWGCVKVDAEPLTVGGVKFMLHKLYRIPNAPPHTPELVRGFRAISRAGIYLTSFRQADVPDVKAHIRELTRKQCGAGEAFDAEKLIKMFMQQFKRYQAGARLDGSFFRQQERLLRAELNIR